MVRRFGGEMMPEEDDQKRAAAPAPRGEDVGNPDDAPGVGARFGYGTEPDDDEGYPDVPAERADAPADAADERKAPG
jgi:hypothetical protein